MRRNSPAVSGTPALPGVDRCDHYMPLAWLREPADKRKGWRVGPDLPGPDRLITAARTGEGASVRGGRGGDRCVPAVSGGGIPGRAAADLPGTRGRADPGGRAGAGAHG